MDQNIDFSKMYDDYHDEKIFKRGWQAEIRRVVSPEDLVTLPSFYKLLQYKRSSAGVKRVVYCLPFIKHKNGGVSLGRALANADVNERRIFQMIRSDSPQDLIQMRRLLQMVKPTLDWQRAAKTIFHWSDKSKANVIEDFFVYHNEHSDKS